jgi:hypothetical protein
MRKRNEGYRDTNIPICLESDWCLDAARRHAIMKKSGPEFLWAASRVGGVCVHFKRGRPRRTDMELVGGAETRHLICRA